MPGGYDGSLAEQLEVRLIRPSRFPVRYADSRSSPEAASLKESIREHGLLQPIVVRPLGHGFEIVAGHRRFAACRSLRWRHVPCRIRGLSDKQAYEIQLTENLQRKSMDPIEEAEAYQRYVVDYGWGGVSHLGRMIGRSEEYVSHRMQLLKLPGAVRGRVTSSELGVSQALELTTVDPATGERLADEIVDGGLTVRQIRRIKGQLGAGRGGADPEDARSREAKIARKGTLTLRVALSRIDDLIEDAHGAGPGERAQLVEFLMGMRRRTHAMIDEMLGYERSCRARPPA